MQAHKNREMLLIKIFYRKRGCEGVHFNQNIFTCLEIMIQIYISILLYCMKLLHHNTILKLVYTVKGNIYVVNVFSVMFLILFCILLPWQQTTKYTIPCGGILSCSLTVDYSIF